MHNMANVLAVIALFVAVCSLISIIAYRLSTEGRIGKVTFRCSVQSVTEEKLSVTCERNRSFITNALKLLD